MGRTGKSKAHWVEGGQTILIENGIEGVKLRALSQRLKLSTGSFYHHFQNLDDYLSQLADYYGSEQAQWIFDTAKATARDDPEAMLFEATELFGRGSMRLLNIAMRAWAHHDKRAAAAVRRFDKVLMANLDQIFMDLGFDELAAKSRTLVLLGLSSVEFDPDLMQPPYRDRWIHIR